LIEACAQYVFTHSFDIAPEKFGVLAADAAIDLRLPALSGPQKSNEIVADDPIFLWIYQ
jgi:hypothetical protein